MRPGRSNGGFGGVIWEVFEVSWEGLGYQLGNSCGCKASTDKVRHVIAKTARIVLARMHFIWNFPLGRYEVEAARSAARDRSSGKLLAVPLASSFENTGLELTVVSL